MEHDPLDPRRRRRRLTRPAQLGQQRSDDVLLLRDRARGAARVRPRRAARAAPVVLPAARRAGGMLVPVLIFLAFNAGAASAHGWGTAMSTDTAFALGLLALVGLRSPSGCARTCSRSPSSTTSSRCSSSHSSTAATISMSDLLIGVAIFAVILGVRAADIRLRPVYFVLGASMWVALLQVRRRPDHRRAARRDYSRSPTRLERGDLERASRSVPAVPRAADAGARPQRARGTRGAVSPNDRLQTLWHPWTSYVIVPLFALGERGHRTSAAARCRAPLQITDHPRHHRRLRRRQADRDPGRDVGRDETLARHAATARRLGGRGRRRHVAGIGFTVSILIASLAFEGDELQQAKVGVRRRGARAPHS